MEWPQLIIFLLSVFGLFIWNRTESRADIRHMDAKLDSNKDLITAIHAETRDLINKMDRESKDMMIKMTQESKDIMIKMAQESNDIMKDFHYRLLEIERNRKSS